MKATCVGTTIVLVLAACNGQRATRQDCVEILDRIVELELRETGFRDPALVARKREELRKTFAPELARCTGRRLPKDALACVRNATSAEEVSHRCLR
jgi:hypothetical protein